MKLAVCFVIFLLIKKQFCDEFYSPCPDVLTYTVKSSCLSEGLINLTSNLTYRDLFLFIKFSTSLYHDTFMEYPYLKFNFQMKNFSSIKPTEELGDLSFFLTEPKFAFDINGNNILPFRLDFGSKCNFQTSLESILLNGEEICFTRSRESVHADYNEVADCQNLQKIIDYTDTDRKYVMTELITPVTVEVIWIVIELHEPFPIVFQKYRFQVKNKKNLTYTVYNDEFYLPYNEKFYITYNYDKDISVKSIEFNGRMICESELDANRANRIITGDVIK